MKNLEQSVLDDIEKNMCWLPCVMDDLSLKECSPEYARDQLSWCYKVCQEETYLAMTHIYNGILQTLVCEDFEHNH